MDLAYFKTLSQYNIWANNLTINWLEQISEADWNKDLGGSMPSIEATVAHIAGAEKVWFERLSSKKAEPFLTTYFKGNKKETIEIWKETSKNLSIFLEELPEFTLTDYFNYTNLAGTEFTSKKFEAIAHVFNHSTYHRGQIINYLRQIGFKEVSSTDLITYYRSIGDI
jgi:uncharacterized damage-inducible protein DinB